MFSKLVFTTVCLLLLLSCSGPAVMYTGERPLAGINITIDPGHGDTQAYDDFRVGPTGEREEWINLRVAKELAKKLSWAGANVLMTRSKDKDVSLGGRATLAKKHQSHLLVSIHHNGSTNDPEMDLPIVYFFGSASQNPASVDFANILLAGMRDKLNFEQAEAGAVYSDHLIYDSGTSILRNTIVQLPGVIGEAGFFTQSAGEGRLKSKSYNKLEAEVYYQAILSYFERGVPFATAFPADSLPYLDLKQTLEFQLDDGFGGAFFEENSVSVFQDGEPIDFSWDPVSGIVKVKPILTDERKVSFQVSGRNFKGNAIHPRPFSFLTETGNAWFSDDEWGSAFKKAEKLFTAITNIDTSSSEANLEILDDALNLYQLSLELQIVHPEARKAEERILSLLELKQLAFELDLSEQIEAQRRRLNEYYPE